MSSTAMALPMAPQGEPQGFATCSVQRAAKLLEHAWSVAHSAGFVVAYDIENGRLLIMEPESCTVKATARGDVYAFGEVPEAAEVSEEGKEKEASDEPCLRASPDAPSSSRS